MSLEKVKISLEMIRATREVLDCYNWDVEAAKTSYHDNETFTAIKEESTKMPIEQSINLMCTYIDVVMALSTEFNRKRYQYCKAKASCMNLEKVKISLGEVREIRELLADFDCNVEAAKEFIRKNTTDILKEEFEGLPTEASLIMVFMKIDTVIELEKEFRK